MKGIDGKFGLKGLDTHDSFGLKGLNDTGVSGLRDDPAGKRTECTWGDQGSSVVDLRCLGLDPDKPITVDWHVVRGQQRVFATQVDPATFKNANYNNGFAALMRPPFGVTEAAMAVADFRAAQAQRPRDPLVRNGLLLAQDILKARQQKEKSNREQANYLFLQGYAAMMMGDTENAKSYISQARKLQPNDLNIQFVESLSAANLDGGYPARKDAYKLVANGLLAIRKQNLAGAMQMLEAAQRLQPNDQFIAGLREQLSKHDAAQRRHP